MEKLIINNSFKNFQNYRDYNSFKNFWNYRDYRYWQCGAVRLKIYIVRAVIQSWNFADFDPHISAGIGFRQWTIIMPLIPISCSSASSCRRCLQLCLRCAKRCSFCSAVSCWRLLLRCSRWIWGWCSSSRGVSAENLPWRGFGATCACVSFAWKIVSDSPMINFDSQTINI